MQHLAEGGFQVVILLVLLLVPLGLEIALLSTSFRLMYGTISTLAAKTLLTKGAAPSAVMSEFGNIVTPYTAGAVVSLLLTTIFLPTDTVRWLGRHLTWCSSVCLSV